MKAVMILVFSFFIFGCSYASDSAEAQRLVDNFHMKMDARDFSGIYDNFIDETKRAIPKDQFVQSITKLQESFGVYKNGVLINTDFRSYISGADRIILTYKANYTSASVKEIFILQKNKNNSLSLVSYEWDGWTKK